MPRKLKVYGWTAQYADKLRVALGDKEHHRQCRAIVAATSLAEVARLIGARRPGELFNLSETGNARELEVALAHPHVFFVASINQGGKAPYLRYDPDLHERIF